MTIGLHDTLQEFQKKTTRSLYACLMVLKLCTVKLTDSINEPLLIKQNYGKKETL